MVAHRFFRMIILGLYLLMAWPLSAQPVDTLALRARADSLKKDAVSLYGNYEWEAALDSYLELAKVLAQIQGEQNQEFANILNNIGICYYLLGDYNEAIAYYTQSLEIRHEVFGEHHADYAAGLNNLGSCYLALSECDEALAYLFQALEVRREVLGEQHSDYAMTLNNIGLCYLINSDYGKGIDYLAQAAETRRKALGEQHPDYAASLLNLGSCYMDLGNYEKAIACISEASRLFRDILGEKHPYYAMSLLNLGIGYAQQYDNLGMSIEYFEEALKIYQEVLGDDHPDTARTLEDLGICYQSEGDYDKAFEYLSKAMEVRRDIYGEQNPEYAHSLYCMGGYYRKVEDFDNAIAYNTEALRIIRNVYGERNPNYTHVLAARGDIYRDMNERDSMSTCYRELYSLVSHLVLNAFTYLPQNQRSMYWDSESYLFTINLPSYAHSLCDDKQFLCTAYDGALFSKGLLLNAETELRRLILESGDEAALALYDELQEERQELDALYEMPVDERPMPADSLETLCETLERELQQKSKAFGDYTKNLSVTWKDVQAALGKRDIAIEFLEDPVSQDTTLYYALTLKPGYDAPHFVELFDLKELEALKSKYADRRNPDGLIYGDKDLYDLVWKPLEQELKGVKNIYFGPSGELYQTAIEYADNGKGPLASQKNVYRLSSTRQLAVNHSGMERSRSAVFGGLKYGASEAVLLADSRKYAQRSLPEDVFFSVDSLEIRGAGGGMMVADLPGTESEALEIDALLRNMGLDNTLRMGDEGTEAAFKDLSGRQENIIHVATHGFYWNGHQARQLGSRLGRTLESEGAGRVQEDASMTRSGLLFAGANNTLRGRERQEGVDDGILTAKEIAQLDLRGTDLLVLSACQTGLGEVSGEGVFGLQRGFKKAGVNTILMSLWQVDDEATSLLMTSFYKELAKGRSKSDALKVAQKAVKTNKDKDFSSPYYWAAFILLDGE